jgi:hypothetical protein
MSKICDFDALTHLKDAKRTLLLLFAYGHIRRIDGIIIKNNNVPNLHPLGSGKNRNPIELCIGLWQKFATLICDFDTLKELDRSFWIDQGFVCSMSYILNI